MGGSGSTGERSPSSDSVVDWNRRIARLFRRGGRPSDQEARYASVMLALYRGVAAASGASVIVDSTKHLSTALLLRRIPGDRPSRGASGARWQGGRVLVDERVPKPWIAGGDAYMDRCSPTRTSFRWLGYNAGFHALRAVGTRMIGMRYEDLVTEPEAQLQRAVALAGLGVSEFPFIRGRTLDLSGGHTIGGNPVRFGSSSLELRQDEGWRQGLSGRQRAVVTGLTFPLLAAYGYLGSAKRGRAMEQRPGSIVQRRARRRRQLARVDLLPIVLLMLGQLVSSVPDRPVDPSHLIGPTTISRPNVLVIVTDDQRPMADALAVMPNVRSLFVEGGRNFPRSVVTTPLCCPSRSSILTGRYAHNTGVLTNGDEGQVLAFDQDTTIEAYLKGAGYRTGIVGKFFNTWPLAMAPPFFDRWATMSGGYHDPVMNVDGAVHHVEGYSTSILGSQTVGILDDFDATDDDAPWFLYVAPHAPHGPYTPDEPYADAAVPPWRSRSSVRRTQHRRQAALGEVAYVHAVRSRPAPRGDS